MVKKIIDLLALFLFRLLTKFFENFVILNEWLPLLLSEGAGEAIRKKTSFILSSSTSSEYFPMLTEFYLISMQNFEDYYSYAHSDNAINCLAHCL